MPNDIATWPDPTSPTGLRINASLVADTGMEARMRAHFSRLDGWGTYGPVTIPFDGPIDVADLVDRQGRGRFGAGDWPEHAVYLVDLQTGLPVPLDLGTGLFDYGLPETDRYFPGDPRAAGTNLLFETVDEDLDGDGALDPGEDTDFDGVLDRPNTVDGRLTGEVHETRDRMLWFYERATDTLMLRPLVPLRETARYAVVVTDRLASASGRPVRSPFDGPHHIAQRRDLAGLPGLFEAHPQLYGEDLADDGWEHVVFAWVFTTQSTTADLSALREGLWGRGPFAWLARQFPPKLVPVVARGGNRIFSCDDPGPRIYTVTPDQIRNSIDTLGRDAFGLDPEQTAALLGTFDAVSHFSVAFFESPYLLGDPDAEDANDVWHVDRLTGRAAVRREWVSMFITVPRETATRRQPFPVTLYAHGYGNLNLESLGFSGLMARQGIATVALDAQGNGLGIDRTLFDALKNVFAEQCLAPLARAVENGRARDLNGDGVRDSAGLTFSAYMFHTRDAIRQTVLDYVQAVRILRSIDGHPDLPGDRAWEPAQVPTRDGAPLVFSGDVDADGDVDRFGDFDGNGVPDVGGYDLPYAMWGVSYGGIITGVTMGVEPAIQVAAPVSGGGGLFDLGLRTALRDARDPTWLRVLGPLLVSVPSAGPSAETGCAAGDLSLRFEVPDLNQRARIEFACMSPEDLVEGDAVVLLDRSSGERRCAGVGAGGRFGLGIPADRGDALTLDIHRGAAASMDYSTCTFTGPEPALVDSISTWRSENGANRVGRCRQCARHQQTVWRVGDPLVAPTEGLGFRRQSPDLRRLAGLAQIALDPGDPINYARRVFLDPVRADDVPARSRSVLVLTTAGDDVVPVQAGNAYARAAGLLPFMGPDAPADFADWRAPAFFETEHGAVTPADLLVDWHVIEGIASLERHPVEGAPVFLVDADDLSEGRQRFNQRGSAQVPEGSEEPSFVPVRLDPPLRWVRESRPAAASDGTALWRAPGSFGAVSGALNAMIYPRGNHVFDPVDPTKPFDEGEYLVNLIGWYMRTRGAELLYHSRPGEHHCLEDSSCTGE